MAFTTWQPPPIRQGEKSYYGNTEQKQEMTFAMCVQCMYTRPVPALCAPKYNCYYDYCYYDDDNDYFILITLLLMSESSGTVRCQSSLFFLRSRSVFVPAGFNLCCEDKVCVIFCTVIK